MRRAFLCGIDHYSGHSFEHRKTWVEARIHLVADCFAVPIHVYAVMSNHLHRVLRIDPVATSTWRGDHVAARRVRLFPPRESSHAAIEHNIARKEGSVVDDGK